MKKNTLNLMKFVKQVYNATAIMIYNLYENHFYKNRGIYSRTFQGESTDFAFTRFLVPYLSNYTGYSLFCDGDFLWRSDPSELMKYAANFMTVSVVKHPKLITSQHTKMNDKVNRPYEKKYWSSLMLFKNNMCHRLTPEYVNQALAGDLHGFKWAKSIGSIPATYNHMIGYYDLPNPKLYTLQMVGLG